MKYFLPCLFVKILTLISLSTCSLPKSEPTVLPTILPTPWKPWGVDENGNLTCILAKFGAEFIVNTKTNLFVYPWSATIGKESHCGTDTQKIQLYFNSSYISFRFGKDTKYFFVNQIMFEYGNNNSVNNTEKLFETPLKYGYKCFSEQTIKLGESVLMKIENLRFEAFRTKYYNRSNDDPEPWQRVGLKCELDRVKSDVVQIIGISLGAGIGLLTFITLVAIWSSRRQEKVMLKVKLMRQWTLEENKAFEARVTAAQNKNKVNKEATNKQATSFENPGYAEIESQKF